MDLLLRQIRWEAEDVASFELVAADGAPLPAFSAGAHIDLQLPQDRVRSYSLANDPAERHHYVIAVHRSPEGRGGSSWLHDVPRVGQSMQASAPSNQFGLDETAALSVFVAGGIGITPILAMLRRLQRLQRPWKLHYAARSPRHAAFVPEIEALAGDRGERFAPCFGSARLDIRQVVATTPADAHLYCCGPARMLDAFLAASSQRPAGNVHFERFGATRAAATEGGFEIVLKRSGRRIAVPAGRSMLGTLLDEGVAVQYACSSGICGTCRTAVMDGTPEHRDDYLSVDEKRRNDSVMLCCSGSRSPTLVLDL